MDETIVRIYRDGDKICALIDENLQEGYAGFGETETDALRALADEMER
jgi:hypothetical protein